MREKIHASRAKPAKANSAAHGERFPVWLRICLIAAVVAAVGAVLAMDRLPAPPASGSAPAEASPPITRAQICHDAIDRMKSDGDLVKLEGSRATVGDDFYTLDDGAKAFMGKALLGCQRDNVLAFVDAKGRVLGTYSEDWGFNAAK